MSFDQRACALGELRGARLLEPQNADARRVQMKNKRAEISVDRDDGAAIAMGFFENGFIAGIGGTLANPNNIVPVGAKPAHDRASHALID